MAETPTRVFYDCIYVKSLWEILGLKFQNDIILPSLTPQAIFRLANVVNSIYNLLNIFLVFKYCLQVNRETHTQYRYFDRQPNTNKEKRKTNKPC